tara:strand:- start:161 stop:901 length:741 start_codon:yes stop_codon:yes gene_type:complete
MTLIKLKTSIASAVAVLALCGSGASAQDAEAWKGGYAGIYVSGALFSVEASDLTETITNDAPPISELVAAGGLKLGYNFAPRQGNLVLGIELDVNGSHATSKLIASNPSGTSGLKFDNDVVLTSLLGRVGVANGDLLTYAVGGPVQARGSYVIRTLNTGSESCNTIMCAQTTEDMLGVALGGGFEWAFSDNMTARFELMHYALPTIAAPILNNDTSPACGGATLAECSVSFKSSSTDMKFVISYQF